MGSVKSKVGLALALIGLVAALYPVVSVWRLSGEVLDLLPSQVSGLEPELSDDRNRFALTDAGFVLAERTYHQSSVEDVEQALRANGFDTLSSPADQLAKECCGAYDAAWVSLEQLHGVDVRATVTAADSDIQVAWPVFVVPGLALLALGVGLLSGGLGVGRRFWDWFRSGPPQTLETSDDVKQEHEQRRGVRGG